MDSKILASGSVEQTIRVCNAESGHLIHGPLKGHASGIQFVAFSPSGERIVSADFYGDVCVWDTENRALVSGPSKRHAEGVLAVTFTSSSTWFSAVSPNGKWIAVVEHGTTVQVWDSWTGLLAATYVVPDVYSIAFSPDSKRILTSSKDKTIRIHTLDCR
jgi:WD40 repeat protein